MLKKLWLILICMTVISVQSAYCAMFSTDFNNVISQQDLERTSTVAIYAKDINTSKVLYARDEDKLLNAASSLKLLTFASALNTLGEDYKFETAFYIEGKNLYLKLGADPLLTKDDLFSLVQKLKKSVNFNNIKYVYIDDNVISNVPYPDGWTVDDFWPCYAPIGPYEIDGNKVSVRLIVASTNDALTIVQNDKYRFSFINEVKIADNNDIKISKDYGTMQNMLTLSGTIAQDCDLSIPVSNPKYLFISRLEEAFGKHAIAYGDKFYFASTPKSAKKIASIYHTIDEVSSPILKNSDNFAAETLFRVAAQKYAQKNALTTEIKGSSLGTTQNAILMFKDYYKNAGLNTDEINLVDGSGVSRYNAFSAKWIVDALIYLDKNTNIRKYMEGADEGTLSKRLRYLKGSLWAKTGTLYGVSSLSGILTGKKGTDTAFSIIIQSYSKSQTSLKAFEDDIVDCIFNL